MSDPRGLEFIWRGTELGVRHEGDEEYEFQDLRGATGPFGVDGSSVVDAELDDDGHLILTIQDEEHTTETTKMLALESGTFTRQDLLDIQTSINRLNRNASNLSEAIFTSPPSNVE